MFKLKNVKALVEKTLREDVKARKDDMYLISNINEQILPGSGSMTLNENLNLIRQSKLPTFESIRRARQSVQQKNPALKDKTTAMYREEKQDEYLEFARCK